MSNLYNSLSEVYEAMYQSFINYKDEYAFYSGILRQHNCNSLIEMGCGTGNLASMFIENKFDYTGMDMSESMLQIAGKKYPAAKFVHADMRNFSVSQKTDAVIITGRTISYLLTSKDLHDAFTCIHSALNKGGIICFDCIDANIFIPSIAGRKKVLHTAVYANKKFLRESSWNINTSHSGAFDWHSVYYEEKENGEKVKIGEDDSVIRAFTKNEITLLLSNAGFAVKEITDRASYAFDTFVVTAEKS